MMLLMYIAKLMSTLGEYSCQPDDPDWAFKDSLCLGKICAAKQTRLG